MKIILVSALAVLAMATSVATSGPAVAQEALVQVREPVAPSEHNLALARRVMAITTPDFDKQVLAHMNAAVAQSGLNEVDASIGRWMEKNAGPILLPHLRQMMDEIVVIYANRFTAEELAAMVTFYESPLGSAIATKQVAVGIETGELLTPLMERYAVELFGELCKEIDCSGTKSESSGTSKPERR